MRIGIKDLRAFSRTWPWRSRRATQDLFLIVSAFLIFAWAAYEFTLFRSLAGEIPPEKHIDLYESIGLGLFLCASLWTFAWRRLRELRDHAIQRDEAEQRAVEAELRALHDPLTGLGNRAKLDACLADLVTGENGTRIDPGTALLLLDLNRFKQVNDRFGHPVGDAVLKIVAMRLSASVRRDDTVFRLGGDEFAVLAPGALPSGPKNNASFAETIADNIIDAIDQPMTIAGHTMAVGVSIGIAYYPQSATTAQELMEKADIALYAAKDDGRLTDCSCYRAGTALIAGLARRNHAPGSGKSADGVA